MLVVLPDSQKADLAFLTTVEPEVLQQFCQITIDFIKSSNQNTKLFSVAAKKLGVRSEVVENGILALCFLFSEAAKINLSELDFVDSLMVLGLAESTNDTLKAAYIENKDDIRSTLSKLSPVLPHFADLDWRLDVQLASRALREQVQPIFILHLDTESNGTRTTQTLQADFTNLRRVQTELETALEELKTAYARRIGRNL